MIKVAIVNRQDLLPIDASRMRRTLRDLLVEHHIARAAIGLAVVDDAEIAALHARYLDDPTPTDVLSFPMSIGPSRIEGEIVVSAETALAAAGRFGLAPADEVLLYAVHGLLHLLGYDDHAPRARAEMRRRERMTLEKAGVVLPPREAPPAKSKSQAGRGRSRGRRTLAEKQRAASDRRRSSTGNGPTAAGRKGKPAREKSRQAGGHRPSQRPSTRRSETS